MTKAIEPGSDASAVTPSAPAKDTAGDATG
jgi:hypothetical protein